MIDQDLEEQDQGVAWEEVEILVVPPVEQEAVEQAAQDQIVHLSLMLFMAHLKAERWEQENVSELIYCIFFSHAFHQLGQSFSSCSRLKP
jgi:hypothetical protein